MKRSTILRDKAGREVVVFKTPSGVTGIIDTSISDKALASFARSLRGRIRRRKAADYLNKSS